MAERIDLRETVRAKTDQLNADDLKIFPEQAMLAQIKRVVNVGGRDQPLNIYLSAWEQPWRPCLSMRRVLVELWGYDGAEFVGKSLRLVRDPKVSFGDQKEIGGIRISHMSDVRDVNDVKITTTRGQKKPYRVLVMTPAMFAALNLSPDPLLPLRAACRAAMRRGWTAEAVRAVLGCDKAEQTAEADRAAMIEKLNADAAEKSEGGEE